MKVNIATAVVVIVVAIGIGAGVRFGLSATEIGVLGALGATITAQLARIVERRDNEPESKS